jgi:hypothetical protein
MCVTEGLKTVVMWGSLGRGEDLMLGGVEMALGAGGVEEYIPSWLPNKLLIM